MTTQHRRSLQRGAGKLLAALAPLFLSMVFLVMPALAAGAMEIQPVTSSKGVTAWLVEDYSAPTVSVRFGFGGGSTQDPPGKEGLANLMIGLLDEGAGPFDSEAFQIRVDDAGAEISFDESRDRIYGSMRMLAEQRDEAFDLLRLAVNEPRFDQASIDRVRAQVLSGIIGGENDPKTVAQNRWAHAIYGDHPYSRSDQGTRQSIAAITQADLQALHKGIFARDGLKVAVVGAIDPETLKKNLDFVFGDLPQNQILAPVADVQPKLAQRIEVNYDLPQTKLQLAWPGVKSKAADFFPAALMNEILGGRPTSRLFQEVREKRGLAYGVNSSLVHQDHTDTLIVATGTRSDRAAETLGIVRDVVKRLAEEGPTEAELAATKKSMIGGYAINNLNSPSAIVATLVNLQLDDLGVDYMERRADYINAVTLDQVKAAARKLLSAEPAILVVGPKLAEAGKDEPNLQHCP
ncbi:M16 family metallopeptidase [Bradyrhizobium sp. Arg314]